MKANKFVIQNFGSLGQVSYEKCKQTADEYKHFFLSGYARDSTGKWQVVVQTEDLPQRVAIDLCHSPGKPCKF